MSIKKNFIYSFILTASNYIFPLLLYPYVSRVLGVSGIGICNFIDSIINYFILFATLGVSIIGIREIAYAKESKIKLNTTYTSLILQIFIPTIFACIIFLLAFCYIPQLYEYKSFMLIGIAKIIGSAFLLDWFYKGIENFKYVTIRTIGIKVLYIISVFVLIRQSEDYLIFFSLTTLMVIANSIFNLVYSRNFVSFKFNSKNFTSLIKPNLINGLYLFLNTMYTTLNVAFLGFVSNTTQVGYYTSATKLFSIILAIYTAFTGVLLPRMSSLISENNIIEFRSLIAKSTNILITFSIPAALVCIILAPNIIDIISGPGYEGAYVPAMLSMPMIFVVGYEQILVIQILTPLRADKSKLTNSIIGAIVGIIGNILLVHSFYAIGSAWVWILSEISVLISAQIFVTKLTQVTFPFVLLSKNILYYIPLLFVIIIFKQLSLNEIIEFGISILFAIIYFCVLQIYILRNPIMATTFPKIIKSRK